MTDEQIKKKVDLKTKKFIKSAEKFLATKAGLNEVPLEWEISLIMLESYFRDFLELVLRIQELPSITFKGRYGEQPSPLLAARDKAAIRLESLLKEMGMTMKSGVKMKVVEPQKDKSSLDLFLEGQNKKKIEKR